MEHFESTNPYALEQFERRETRVNWGLVIAVLLDIALVLGLLRQQGTL